MVSVPAVVAALIAAFAAIRRRQGQGCTALAQRSGRSIAEEGRAATVLPRDAKDARGTRVSPRGIEASGGKQSPNALAGLAPLTPTRPLEGHECGPPHLLGQTQPIILLFEKRNDLLLAFHARCGRNRHPSCGTS